MNPKNSKHLFQITLWFVLIFSGLSLWITSECHYAFKPCHDPIGIVDRGKGSPQIYTNHRKEGFRAITDKTIIKSSWNTCGYDVLLATIEVEIRLLQLAYPKN